MITIYNSKLAKIILWKKFAAVMLFGMIFTTYGKGGISKDDINHEHIHAIQWIEIFAVSLFIAIIARYFIQFSILWLMLSSITYYALYAVFWAVYKLKGYSKRQSYHRNPFEIEAFDNEHDMGYISKRSPFAWVKYLIS